MSELFISKLISSVIQILLFAFIPFVWFITSKNKQSFTSWLGLIGINKEKRGSAFIWTASCSIVFIAVGFITLIMLKDVSTAASEFYGRGIGAVPAILVYAIFNTSFPEELFFRGFLLKRLQNKFGFVCANLLQSVIFGLVHGIMFFSVVGIIKALIIISLTSAVSAAMGYINEKKANGSIIPSWIIHASSNIFSGLWYAFL